MAKAILLNNPEVGWPKGDLMLTQAARKVDRDAEAILRRETPKLSSKAGVVGRGRASSSVEPEPLLLCNLTDCLRLSLEPFGFATLSRACLRFSLVETAEKLPAIEASRGERSDTDALVESV